MNTARANMQSNSEVRPQLVLTTGSKGACPCGGCEDEIRMQLFCKTETIEGGCGIRDEDLGCSLMQAWTV